MNSANIQILSLKRVPYGLIAELVYDGEDFYRFTLGDITEHRALELIPTLVQLERNGEERRRGRRR